MVIRLQFMHTDGNAYLYSMAIRSRTLKIKLRIYNMFFLNISPIIARVKQDITKPNLYRNKKDSFILGVLHRKYLSYEKEFFIKYVDIK